VIWDAETDQVGWPRRKKLGVPHWLWLLLLVAVVAGAVAFVVSSGDDEDAVSPVTTEEESVDTTIEVTAPPVTDSIPTTTTDAVPTTEPTVETTVPVTTPAPSTEVAGAPAGLRGDRANPVPVGAIADIGGGWRLQVLNVVPDATDAIIAENSFNEPPQDGYAFTMITVALGYFGLADPKTTFETTISAVGASNVELVGECGVIPQELNTLGGEIFSGGVVQGNICFATTPDDAATLQLYATGDFIGGEPTFLDASKPPDEAAAMVSMPGPQPGAASTPARLAPNPIGAAAGIGADWQLIVNGPAVDITDSVLAENEFNAPPANGFRFVGVNVTYAYGGAGASSTFAVTAGAVGNGNISFLQNCGVIPDAIDLSADIFAGGSVTGNLCFVAPADDPTFLLYATADFSAGKVMFAT
jgi:hypothetical protein